MKIKYAIILLFIFCFSGSLMAHVVMSKGLVLVGRGYHETWYLGSNEVEFLYHKHGGGQIDDGLFVAIRDGGRYAGYSYYEIRHPFIGVIDGGPAYLPDDPSGLPVSGFYAIASGYGSNHNGLHRYGRGGPELPDGSRIPIGSKFFYWLSGGGNFNLVASVLEPMTKLLTVKTQAIPKGEYAKWFESSAINEKSFMIKKG